MNKLLITILIVLTIIACGDNGDDATYLNDCSDCELVAPDTPTTPINVMEE